jgi:hypothetical protein
MPGDDEVVEEAVEIDESAADQAEEVGDPDDDAGGDDLADLDGKKEV